MTTQPRFLVVDDEEVVCRSCARILEQHGYKVEMRTDPSEGLKQATEKDYAAVILDVRMPGINGIEFLGELKKSRPDLPVIMITGYSSVQSATAALRLGAADYVQKPFTPEEITVAVKKLLHSQPPPRASAAGVAGPGTALRKPAEEAGEDLRQAVRQAVSKHGNDRTRLMDVVRAVQAESGAVPGAAMDLIAAELGIRRVEVESVVSFYTFLSRKPKGRTVIRLSNCPVCRLKGADRVAETFEQELGIRFGETTTDGKITLEHTSCIGLCDQGPAALCNSVPVTDLSPGDVKKIVKTLEKTADPEKLVAAKIPEPTDDPRTRASGLVATNVRRPGPVVFDETEAGSALRAGLAATPEEVIERVKSSKLRGRGGAGFPAGLKWEFAREVPGQAKYLICNADEGEPGTFKDRAILTCRPDLVFDGMTLAGYAIGAEHGVMYLRAEYEYLRPHLEAVLSERRDRKLAGKDVCGKEGFNFDIRIQMGAGAYICGEESALIESCEGKRGTPRDRPPFPVESGYLLRPTVVNNVETLCCAARIAEKGAEWFAGMGTSNSTGTKLFSVSGDCKNPGVYELPFGLTIKEFLKEVGGEDAAAVQVGGPSGTCVGPDGFNRRLCFEDLATGGSMMVFGPDRDLLKVASQFMDFFIEESCGWCAPCRVGNVLIKERLDRIRSGKGVAEDLEYLENLCVTVKKTSRCGLGQTSPNPVQATIQAFRHLYTARLVGKTPEGLKPSFDFQKALAEAVKVQGRQPVFHRHQPTGKG